MLFRLVRPVKRKESRNQYFVRRIPTDVRKKANGLKLSVPVGDETQTVAITPRTQSIRISLRTNDPAEVKRRLATVDEYLEGVWTALRRDEEAPLSHRQATALAGDLYRAWASGEGRERTIAVEHTPEGWKRVEADHLEPDIWEGIQEHWEKLGADPKDDALEKSLGPLLDRLLLSKGVGKLTATSRSITLQALWVALRDAWASRKRNAEGDYSPDSTANRFPVWQVEKDTVPYAPRVSLTGLVESWWQEAKATGRKVSTKESYENTMAAFVEFLKHDDATRVSKQDVVAFKDYRLASINPRTGKPISPKTVKDSDLSGLKTVFVWAVANDKLRANPAEGVTIKLGKAQKLRSKGFTDEEAKTILRKASNNEDGSKNVKMFAAKRWVPWLCAYSGARVGEMAQLRKQDVRKEGEWWVAKITPEAGTVKNNEARDVVLHHHLVELGFVKFVMQAAEGHLFLTPSSNGDVRGPLRALKNRLAEFVREVVSDKAVAPNHAWRHRFKTVGMEVGVEHRILDAIQGQSPRSVSETYGDVSLKTHAAAIKKFPRYKIG
ncbi:MAG: site-specific integrase [Xanthobacteraceae bacterium]|nr:site-specific integrase [Xanthobacteraceae bacterium]